MQHIILIKHIKRSSVIFIWLLFYFQVHWSIFLDPYMTQIKDKNPTAFKVIIIHYPLLSGIKELHFNILNL